MRVEAVVKLLHIANNYSSDGTSHEQIYFPEYLWVHLYLPLFLLDITTDSDYREITFL